MGGKSEYGVAGTSGHYPGRGLVLWAAVLSLVLGLAVILPSVLLLVNTSTWHHVNKSIQRWLVENHWDRQVVAIWTSLLTYRRSSDNTFQGLFCLLSIVQTEDQIVAGDPICCPLLPLAGRPSRTLAWWTRPLLGPPCPLLPPPSPGGNAPPTSSPRPMALL